MSSGGQTLEEYQDYIIKHVLEEHAGEDALALSLACAAIALPVAEALFGDERGHEPDVMVPLALSVGNALVFASMQPEWVRRMVLEAHYEREEQRAKEDAYRTFAEKLAKAFVPQQVPLDDTI